MESCRQRSPRLHAGFALRPGPSAERNCFLFFFFARPSKGPVFHGDAGGGIFRSFPQDERRGAPGENPQDICASSINPRLPYCNNKQLRSETTDQFEFRSTRRKKRSNVPHRRLAEEAAVFAIELGCAFVADLKGRAGRIETIVQHQTPR
jgi:hypothetical protein